MFEDITTTAWVLYGLLACTLLVLVYGHMEGNLFSATRFHHADMRRELHHLPDYEVWWRAFRRATGARRF